MTVAGAMVIPAVIVIAAGIAWAIEKLAQKK